MLAERQWFMDLPPFCIFVIFVNMDLLNCCKNGFFCKMFFNVYIQFKPLYILELCNTLSLVFIFSKNGDNFIVNPSQKNVPEKFDYFYQSVYQSLCVFSRERLVSFKSQRRP